MSTLPSTLGILPWTLLGTPGVGPSRERAAWLAGGWDPAVLPEVLRSHLGLTAERAQVVLEFQQRFLAAIQGDDFRWLWDAIPSRERWRLTPLLLHRSVSLDIEMDGQDRLDSITAVSLRSVDRAECWVKDTPAQSLLDMLSQAPVLLSFNGAAFDVPRLKACWPDLELSRFHLDLAPLTRRLGIHGGLKALETKAGWSRAPHVAHLRGGDAISLWNQWLAENNESVLQQLLEYNMEDVWSLPYLAAWCHDRLVEKCLVALPGAPPPASAAQVWHSRDDAGPMMLKAVASCMFSASKTAT